MTSASPDAKRAFDPTAHEPVEPSACWTRGGDRFVFQHCSACGHHWSFHRCFCPQCGQPEPRSLAASGRGRVAGSTLVHRAPDDRFRAIAPYRIVLVDTDEGLRLMAHADPALVVGDRVRGSIRAIAGRPLPYFEKETDV